MRLSYDIWCSYHVNLKKRFAKFFPRAASLLDRLQGAIPKMHVKNHIEACQLLWAFNYLQGSGETCGEQIETGCISNFRIWYGPVHTGPYHNTAIAWVPRFIPPTANYRPTIHRYVAVQSGTNFACGYRPVWIQV